MYVSNFTFEIKAMVISSLLGFTHYLHNIYFFSWEMGNFVNYALRK